MSEPNEEQWAALRRWARDWGRLWKSHLSAAWFNGNYGLADVTAEDQRLVQAEHDERGR